MNVLLRQRLVLYQYVAGICETVTGLFLLGFPILTVSRMGLIVIPERAFIRYIGVFVFSIGLTYLWTVIRWPLNEYNAPLWLAQWKITAFIRSLAAVFIIWQIMFRAMESRWIMMAVFDGVFGAIQFIGLEQEWIERAV